MVGGDLLVWCFFSKVFKEKRGHTVSPGNEERKAGGDSSFRWICKNLSSQYIYIYI